MIMYNKSRTGKDRGFTLLELSIVLLVLSVMASGIMTVMTQNARATRNAELTKKMDAIENALIAYRKANNRIPCPADGTTLITASTFGVESVNAGSCTTGATYNAYGGRTASGTISANFFLNYTVGGVVPTKTLGLPDDYMFDPWGGRFRYMADIRATGTNAFSTYAVNSTLTTIPSGIFVYDTSGNGITTSTPVLAAVISHGPNGHGAFQLSGTVKSSKSANTNELMNCGCNSAAPPVPDATYPFSRFIAVGPNQGDYTDPLKSFDDTVRFYTRAMLSSSTDLLTETR